MDLARLLSIAFAGDGKKATLNLAECAPAPGRSGLHEDEVVQAVEALAQSRGVVVRLDGNALRSAVGAWLRTGRHLAAVVATAQLAVDGKDATVTLVKPAAHVDASGRAVSRVDRRNLSFVQNATQGDVLARAVRATPGAPGRTVTGAELPARAGKEATISVNESILVEEGPRETVYRAARTGILREHTATRLEVGDSIEIKRDVDHATGNIDAWGAVSVLGSIVEGFSVRARGDVTITGACESAFIESGGDVTIGGGLLGRSGVTEVRARGKVTARFVENAKVEAGGDVLVHDSILNSRVASGGAIDVKGRGAVLSSTLAAARSIAAVTFGSEARIQVVLLVGADPSAWRRLEHLRDVLRFARRASKKGMRVRGKEHGRAARAEEERAAKLRRSIGVSRELVRRKERALAATLLEGGGPTVIIRAQAFPKTSARLGPHSYEVPHPGLGAGVLHVDTERGEVVFSPPSASGKEPK